MAGGIRADNGRSYRTIEQRAASVRRVLVPGISPLAELPCMTLFERLDRFAVGAPDREDIRLTYAVSEFPRGVDGLTRYDEDVDKIVVALSADTYKMLEENQPRARFALAHEVGHAALHSAELLRLSEIPHGDLGLYRRSGHAQCFDSEWQANSLAAALLMPAAGLAALEARGQAVSAELLQLVYGVSQQAAEIRTKVFRERRTELISS